MEAVVKSALVFELHGDSIEVTATAAPDGAIERLSYRSGDDEHEFSGDEITNVASPEGHYATVTLENGAADGPIVTFTLLVPDVVSPDDGPFELSAAAVVTRKPSGFGGPHPGPLQSYAALTMKGTVAWRGADCGSAAGSCHDWAAWHNRMPVGPFTLIVTGSCTFPTPGYSVELRPHVPQGINPADFLLDRIVTAPEGVQPQVLDEVEVRYEQPDNDCETVTILPDGPTIKVDIAV